MYLCVCVCVYPRPKPNAAPFIYHLDTSPCPNDYHTPPTCDGAAAYFAEHPLAPCPQKPASNGPSSCGVSPNVYNPAFKVYQGTCIAAHTGPGWNSYLNVCALGPAVVSTSRPEPLRTAAEWQQFQGFCTQAKNAGYWGWNDESRNKDPKLQDSSLATAKELH